MNYNIDCLRLPSDLDQFSITGEEKDNRYWLKNLSTVNFFVGANNSGKSRLLRRMTANENTIFRPSFYPQLLQSHGRTLKSFISAVFGPDYANNFTEISHSTEFLSRDSDLNTLKHKLSEFCRNLENRLHYNNSVEITTTSIAWEKELIRYLDSNELRKIIGSPWNRIYIPSLRGLRPINSSDTSNEGDIYEKRTKKDYFKGTFPTQNIKGEIYTGLTFYRDLRNLLLGDHDARKTARDFETFLSRELFGGESVTLIPREGHDVVFFKLGNAPEREIHNVGDGLQHLIILTFPLFKYRNQPCQVFIEEPELFLHPGMQRALIKAMRTFKLHQFFIATHSNHFLDLTLEFDDISIFTLDRLEEPTDSGLTYAKFEITLVSYHDFRVLEVLGTRSSSVFLSNCTIWIEGITDRRYLTHYLRLYIEQLEAEAEAQEDGSRPFIPRQDLHYSFVEYSGGNITHWSFLDQIEDPILVDRLCAKAMLITDKDKGKDARHAKLEEKLKDDYYCLECSEIENLLTPEVLRKVLVSYGEDDASIKKFTQEQYVDKKLGKFLETRLSEKKRTASYAMASGTISDKIEFCDRAVEAMPAKEDLAADVDASNAFRFDQLSGEAQRLAMKLYRFIAAHNRR